MKSEKVKGECLTLSTRSDEKEENNECKETTLETS